MVSRLLRFFILFSCLAASLVSAAPLATGRSDAEEAERLYRRANDYVSHITEAEYSYNYLQFHWKRAQANLDRILRVYGQTPTGKKLASGELKIGPFEATYFKERVLPRVELKRLGAYDAVNASIFLYNLQPLRWDAERLKALEAILEVLARQQRWNEAMIFPVRDEDKLLRLTTVYRIAARFDQPKVMKNLREKAKPEELAALDVLDAEAMVLLGREPSTIDAFLAEHPAPAVRQAALEALVDRELYLRHGYVRIKDPTKGISTTHFSLLNPSVRDDVNAAAARWFKQLDAVAQQSLARYQAALGQRPAANAAPVVHAAFVRALIKAGKIEDAESYVAQAKPALRTVLRLEQIQRLAEAGERDAARALARAFAGQESSAANAAALALFTGEMECTSPQLTVQPDTFSALAIDDPCMLVRALMGWSLTPNRSIRGAAPWDAVVRRFLPGFENLPLPDSKEMGQASSLLKPY